MLSVIVPAHDESMTVGRCLAALLADAEPGELEVVVVCNGCHDNTAEVARSFGSPVTVVEIDTASKYLALRAGDAHAHGFPRFYIDADVVAGTQDLREVAAVLDRGEALVAAPAMRMALDGRPWHVRSFYRMWMRVPYVQRALVGCGFYALSESGRRRFGEFPDLIADDTFVLSCFEEAERCSVQSARFVVEAPRDCRGLVHRMTRSYLGNRQLQQRFGPRGRQPGGRSAWLGVLRRQPSLLSSAPVYLLVCATAHLRARRQASRRDFSRWERDLSTRVVSH